MDYLNLSIINQDDGSITVDQERYVTLLETELPARTKLFLRTTADPHLFRLDGTGEIASNDELRFYKSKVQKLAFMAQRTRPKSKWKGNGSR